MSLILSISVQFGERIFRSNLTTKIPVSRSILRSNRQLRLCLANLAILSNWHVRVFNHPVVNVLIKWLVIACLVLSVLLIVLLALGYLLSENEKKTRALMGESHQLESIEEQPTRNPIPAQVPSIETAELSDADHQLVKQLKQLKAQQQLLQVKQTIINNLVCQDVSQCRFVDTGSIELGCVVAVNSIGASMLDKLTFKRRDSECEEQISQLSLTCHHNICSIK